MGSLLAFQGGTPTKVYMTHQTYMELHSTKFQAPSFLIGRIIIKKKTFGKVSIKLYGGWEGAH